VQFLNALAVSLGVVLWTELHGTGSSGGSAADPDDGFWLGWARIWGPGSGTCERPTAAGADPNPSGATPQVRPPHLVPCSRMVGLP
jgi:hypothetical protein